MYSNDEVQQMIDKCNSDSDFAVEVLHCIKNDDTRRAISRVLLDGYYETFDNYDSDVCEQFIEAYIECSQKDNSVQSDRDTIEQEYP